MVHSTISNERLSRVLSAFAVFAAAVVVTALLLPNPLADVFFAGIVLLAVVFALVGAVGAWTNRPPLVWVAALLLTGLSIFGMLSVGFLFVPAALLLLGAAVFSQRSEPRTDRGAILDDPPTRQTVVGKALVGLGAVAVGAVLVYVGAFTQELFGACASETLACALDKMNWPGVGLTLLGLLAVSVGGWLLWRQVVVVRVLGATQAQ